MAYTRTIKIINILLSSIDGKIAAHGKESSVERRKFKFTNSNDFKHLQKLTAQCDAVLIGSKSIESEQGAFSVGRRGKNGWEPHWFVMTQSGNINFEHAFWKQKNIPKSVFQLMDRDFTVSSRELPMSSRGLTAGAGLAPYEYYFKGDIFEFLDFLKQKKFKKIALLGGGELNAYFWENNLVSELCLTLSPQIIGDKTAPQLISGSRVLRKMLRLQKVHKKGNFLFLHYKVVP